MLWICVQVCEYMLNCVAIICLSKKYIKYKQKLTAHTVAQVNICHSVLLNCLWNHSYLVYASIWRAGLGMDTVKHLCLIQICVEYVWVSVYYDPLCNKLRIDHLPFLLFRFFALTQTLQQCHWQCRHLRIYWSILIWMLTFLLTITMDWC